MFSNPNLCSCSAATSSSDRQRATRSEVGSPPERRPVSPASGPAAFATSDRDGVDKKPASGLTERLASRQASRQEDCSPSRADRRLHAYPHAAQKSGVQAINDRMSLTAVVIRHCHPRWRDRFRLGRTRSNHGHIDAALRRRRADQLPVRIITDHETSATSTSSRARFSATLRPTPPGEIVTRRHSKCPVAQVTARDP